MEGCGRKIGPYDCCTIVTGDARELAKAIPDESVDLIFTDPVYDRIEDYRWLAETAVRVLKPDRPALVWIANALLPDVLSVTCPPLTYAWKLENHRVGASNFGRNGRLITKLETCLWLEKGHSKPLGFVWDYFQSVDYPRGHPERWDKSLSCGTAWVEAWSAAGAVILDTFTGYGMTPAVCKMLGRHYLAFEIDPDVAERARERVRNTQPPLFVLQPEQTQFEI
jgi:hypothetical protein